MAKLIKQIFDLVALSTDKGLTNYHSPEQIMDVVDQAQMGLYRPLIKEFAKTKIIRNELLPFQKRSSVTITSKIGALPTDFEHEIDAWVTVDSIDYEVRLFEAGMFRRRLRDPIDIPSITNLIGNIYLDTTKKIEVSNQLYYTFVITAANATVGATYTNNGKTFTVLYTIASGTVLVCEGTGAPTVSGTLTKVTGTGSTTITFASVDSPLVLNYFKRPVKPVYATALAYTFTVTSANATVGATYTNNGQTFTVLYTIASGTTLVCSSTGAPASSGTLTKATGTGDATITFASVVASTQYAYSDSASTDVEWSGTMQDILVERSLGLLGLSLREGQVQRAGQHPEPLEASAR